MESRSTDYHVPHLLNGPFRPQWNDSIYPPHISDGIAGFNDQIV